MKPTLFLDRESTGKWILYLTILVTVYWLSASVINVYSNPVLGAAFEILWLPMVALIFVIPVFCLLIILRKGTVKALPVISLVLIGVTLLLMLIN